LLLRLGVDEDTLFGAEHVEVKEFVKIERWGIRIVEFKGNVVTDRTAFVERSFTWPINEAAFANHVPESIGYCVTG
jgi:hypothetical protein